uniref:Uncharacterized protein n=1 Tax=Cacopsylla melanoneura TaxID=428564 RepID=A0A8D9APL7_9HEMI
MSDGGTDFVSSLVNLVETMPPPVIGKLVILVFGLVSLVITKSIFPVLVTFFPVLLMFFPVRVTLFPVRVTFFPVLVPDNLRTFLLTLQHFESEVLPEARRRIGIS